MRLLDLFIASSIPVAKLLLVGGLGAVLSLDRINILGEDARKHLNNMVFFVFSPALVGSNLAKTITYESLIKLWFMPVNILITFIVGSLLGWVVVLITKAPLHLRGLVVGCCAAGNLGNMLLIIIPTVCKEKGSPFGDPDICHKYGMSYASLSMAIGAIYIWTYVYNIVRISSSMSPRDVEINDSSVSKSEERLEAQPDCCHEPLLSSEDFPRSEGHADQFTYNRLGGKTQVDVFDNLKHNLEVFLGNINFKRLFAPSTSGAIIGFIVGLVPQIRKALIGDAAPFRVLQDSSLLLADGAIPSITLILGGNLLRGFKGPGIQKSLIVGIIVARYIILPLIGIVIVIGALRLGLVPSDPLYQFVLLLQFALPPAMNIGIITQLFGAGESECSVIMLWSYAMASVSLTLWSTVFMWMVA